MKTALIIGGLATAGIATAAPPLLASASSTLQTGVFQPIGTFLINNQMVLTIVGLLMILVGLFL